MAIEKVIDIKVNSNIDTAESKLKTLKTGLKDVGNQAQQTTGEISGMSKAQDTINAIGDGVSKLNPAFGAAVKGANGLILKMWEMVANPVGAILAGIVVTAKFLYEAFQSSVAGGKELKTIFAAISAVGAQVKDAMFGLGRALIDVSVAAYKFITLDFKGAAESMKKANEEASNSYNQLSDAVDGTTFNIIKNLEKQQQANDKARKNQAVVQSETNKLLVQSREILTDETASINEKKKALEEVTKAEKASSAEKVRIAAEDLRIAKAKASQMGGEAEKKAKQELRDLTIALNDAETENAMTGIKLNKQRKMLGRQEAADAKEAHDKEKERLKERDELRKKDLESYKAALKAQKDATTANELEITKAIEEAYDKNAESLMTAEDVEIRAVNDKYFKLLELAKEQKRSKEDIDALEIAQMNEVNDIKIKGQNQHYADKKALEDGETANKKANADAQEEIDKKKAAAREQWLAAGANTLKQASSLLGESTAEGKALAIAATTIDTYQSATAAYKSLAGIPVVGPALGGVAAGVAVASGLANVKKILSVKVPGKASGGAGGAVGGAAPSAPQFNVVGNSGVNQLAGVMSTNQQVPVKAYVVPSDVTTGQSLDRNIIRNASLG
jgi:hypothetical protein